MNNSINHIIHFIILLLIIAFVITSCSTRGYDNEKLICDKSAKIDVAEVSGQQLDNLELLGKVWGLLKYHHPAVASGHYDWDLELVEMLPEYLQVSNTQARDIFLMQWIEKLGTIKRHKAQKPDKGATMKPDYDWIEQLEMSAQLREKLHEIIDNRYQHSQFYVKLPKKGAVNPIIKNEYAYKDQNCPSLGIRLIAVYRYWNIINYYFPYRYLTDNEWSTVLKKHLPDFIAAHNEQEYTQAVNMLVAEINDTHAGSFSFHYYNSGNYYAPYKLQFIEDQLVVVGYYDKTLCDTTVLKRGDVITAINSQKVTAMTDSLSEIISASNKGSLYRIIAQLALKSQTNSIDIQYFSSDSILKTAHMSLPSQDEWLERYYEQALQPMQFIRITPETGYVNLFCNDENYNSVLDSIQKVPYLIVDMRESIGLSGVKWNSFAEFITNSETPTCYAKFSKPCPEAPGEFEKGGAYYTQNSINTYKGKVAILINSTVQSHSEFNIMLMKTNPNVTIVGSNTAGADGDVTVFNLPYLQSMFSGVGVYYPDWSETQRIGIVPDVYVEPTIRGIRENRDEVLEKAFIIEQTPASLLLKSPC